MKKTKFNESQIIKVLAEQDQGIKVADICRKHGISEATFYNWKSKYGGMGLSELKRLRELEQENYRLKKLVADLSLDNQILKDFNEKKF
ncbi:MAG: transposase [Cyclobacteriaceae bacterium]|nr:transposase [Cyclobacteriaceae bacterium]